MSTVDPWPLRHLALRTPRLELRPDDDEGLLELAVLAAQPDGVHDPDTMPFGVPWTRADPATIARTTLLHAWARRGQQSDPASYWHINFLIRHDGKVIGSQTVSARSFPVLHQVGTGSWLGRAHQGHGFGTEMRAAVLLWAFDHLGAQRAYSHAFADNSSSQAVSAKLGYTETGRWVHVREGAPANLVRLDVDPHTFIRPGWELGVRGHLDPSTSG